MLKHTGSRMLQHRRASISGPSRSAAHRITRRRVTLVQCGQPPSEGVKTEGRRLRVRYLRRDQNYKGWWLHTWGDVESPTDWAEPLPPSGWQDGCPYWDLPLREEVHRVGLQIHRGEDKAAGGECDPRELDEVWLAAAHQGVYTHRPSLAELPAGDLGRSYANWVSRSELVWRTPLADEPGTGGSPRHFYLHYSKGAQLYISGEGVGGEDFRLRLEPGASQLPDTLKAKYPYLDGSSLLQLPKEHWDKVPHMLQGQLAMSVTNEEGVVLDCTGVQTAGVLDDLFYTDAPLGPHWDAALGSNVISVWAPTAHLVELLHWEQLRGGEPSVYTMTRGEDGVWSYIRPVQWQGTCYKFRVVAFCPWSNKIETMEVTDPYSKCTTANGERTLLVDVNAPELMPAGWQQDQPPKVDSWHDISVYELHIRDFSVMDDSVPPHLRGKYRAFCPHHVNPQAPQQLSAGLSHLSKMAAAGITHIHLLPSYDYGSVPEREEEQARVQEDLSQYPPDSDRQQAAVAAIADTDGFNWGYDPVHYSTPEGSYSTQPDGPQRILEYREMVQSLHALGFNVVCDVVYNHTFAAGPWSHNSVLDKVVPGYYHRRGENGELLHSTCCNNTASEHRMFERLMIDDLRHWATTYKIDGFRFDIMGHHLVSNIANIRDALNTLTPANSGVDGKRIYLYGEAWNFGEMTENQRGINACQLNLGGMQIGAFNDRMRDGAMGGSPYSPADVQGFVTGLVTEPNDSQHQGPPEQQLDMLLHGTDWVRYSLAGNLRSYQLQVHTGQVLTGEQATYHGNQPVAYCLDPVENVVYNGCHDNETIFDQVMMKAATHLDAEGHAQRCLLALGLLVLSQGIPFIHAGDDLLRSKSLDRDSYNSGDWFNRVDWTGQHNNFGVGLPPASKNGHAWPFKQPLLAAADKYRPSPQLIQRSSAFVQALLRVRYSSPLFRMRSAEHVLQQLHFHNTGPNQVPGVIIMQLTSADSPAEGAYDQQWHKLLVVFNARPEPYQVTQEVAGEAGYRLHPELQQLQDAWLEEAAASSRGLRVGARTTAVLVLPRN